MISINSSSVSTAKLTDRSVVSTCLLGFSNLGTGLSGILPSVRRPPCLSRDSLSASAMSDR